MSASVSMKCMAASAAAVMLGAGLAAPASANDLGGLGLYEPAVAVEQDLTLANRTVNDNAIVAGPLFLGRLLGCTERQYFWCPPKN